MVSRAEQVEPDAIAALVRDVQKLRRELRELRASRRMESATISKGGITIKDGGGIRLIDDAGRVIGLIGDLGGDQRGFILDRAGGYPALRVYGTGQGNDTGFVGLYDLSGDYIVTDDTQTRRGLARPYIPIPLGRVGVPDATTTSGNYADLAIGIAALQHPVLYAHLLVRASDGTTAGQVRMTIDGAAVGPAPSVSAGAYEEIGIGPFALGAARSDPFELKRIAVQARRTAGTGTIGVRVLSLLGLESAWA